MTKFEPKSVKFDVSPVKINVYYKSSVLIISTTKFCFFFTHYCDITLGGILIVSSLSISLSAFLSFERFNTKRKIGLAIEKTLRKEVT